MTGIDDMLFNEMKLMTSIRMSELKLTLDESALITCSLKISGFNKQIIAYGSNLFLDYALQTVRYYASLYDLDIVKDFKGLWYIIVEKDTKKVYLYSTNDLVRFLKNEGFTKYMEEIDREGKKAQELGLCL